MLEVYHYPLCPFSRKLRVILREKQLEFELFQEQYWERRKAFIRLNPAGNTPVVIFGGNKIISGNNAIYEYIEETRNIDNSLIYGTPEQRAEIRRVNEWFDVKFYNEVTKYLFNEKIFKTINGLGAPNSEAIRAAKTNILYHLDYITFLLRDNRYLLSDAPCLADYAAAAQISVVDFIGDVPWKSYERVKDWYSLIKSRPSFKQILMDKVPGFTPPDYYIDPDF